MPYDTSAPTGAFWAFAVVIFCATLCRKYRIIVELEEKRINLNSKNMRFDEIPALIKPSQQSIFEKPGAGNSHAGFGGSVVTAGGPSTRRRWWRGVAYTETQPDNQFRQVGRTQWAMANCHAGSVGEKEPKQVNPMGCPYLLNYRKY